MTLQEWSANGWHTVQRLDPSTRIKRVFTIVYTDQGFSDRTFNFGNTAQKIVLQIVTDQRRHPRSCGFPETALDFVPLFTHLPPSPP